MDTYENIPNGFSSLEEELKYWKQRSFHYQKKYDEQREEFDEFVEYSKTVEHELDVELKQLEGKNKEMKTALTKVCSENENLRSRVDQMNSEYNAQLTDLTSEVASFRKTSDEVNAYVRVLEQKNDDLERANRALMVSIEDFETKLNQAIERNVFLESELDEKETLKGMVQRLKDETRDLQGELALKRTPVALLPQPDNKEYSKESYKSPQIESKPPRSSPLTIVNDLLRKVGGLESKLASYNRDHSLRRKLNREFVK